MSRWVHGSKTVVLGAQKNSLIGTVLLSTHKMGFGSEIRIYFDYTLLSGGLYLVAPCLSSVFRISKWVRLKPACSSTVTWTRMIESRKCGYFVSVKTKELIPQLGCTHYLHMASHLARNLLLDKLE